MEASNDDYHDGHHAQLESTDIYTLLKLPHNESTSKVTHQQLMELSDQFSNETNAMRASLTSPDLTSEEKNNLAAEV